MSESIFEAQATPEVPPVVENPPSAPVLPPEVVEFVGNGKKYSSVEDALRSVPHAQKHIQTLEQELQQMKEELTKRKTTADLLDEIKSGIPPVEKTSPIEISQDKIVATVAQVLAQRDAEAFSKKNISTVTSSFSATFGDKAEEKYIQIATDSGLTVQQLNSLSASSPQAVLKLAGLTVKQEGAQTKTQSTINTEALLQNSSSHELSARVPKGATTKDMVAAWRVAGEKVKQQS